MNVQPLAPRRLGLTVLCAACLGLLPAGRVLASQLHKLVPDDVEADDFFGGAVAIDGNAIVVGANNHGDSGAAYVFDAVTGQQVFKLIPSDAAVGDSFGYSAAVDGQVAIFGSRSGDMGSVDPGSAYLFDVSTGQELQKLVASDADPLDAFGVSVGLSGNIAVVGAQFDDERGAKAGAAYVFDATTGQQLFKLAPSDAGAFREFGRSVAVDGSLAIIGAFDQTNRNAPGAAYVFDVTTGQELFKLTASDAAPNDFFGGAVALSANLALVGAFGGDGSGSAYLFDATTGQELFQFTNPNPTPVDQYGRSVAIDGDLAVVGSIFHDQYGAAFVFDAATGQLEEKFIGDRVTFDQGFGWSVGISGKLAVVGAPHDLTVTVPPSANEFRYGAAYVFFIPEPSTALLALAAFGVLRAGPRSRVAGPSR